MGHFDLTIPRFFIYSTISFVSILFFFLFDCYCLLINIFFCFFPKTNFSKNVWHNLWTSIYNWTNSFNHKTCTPHFGHICYRLIFVHLNLIRLLCKAGLLFYFCLCILFNCADHHALPFSPVMSLTLNCFQFTFAFVTSVWVLLVFITDCFSFVFFGVVFGTTPWIPSIGGACAHMGFFICLWFFLPGWV